MGKNRFMVQCPHCTNNISLFKVREEFNCPYCGSHIRCPNYVEINLKAPAVYLAITFIFYFLKFTIFLVVLDMLIGLLVFWAYINKYEFTVMKGPTDKDVYR